MKMAEQPDPELERAQQLIRGTAAAVEYQLRVVLEAVNHVQNVNYLRSRLSDALAALTRPPTRG